MAPVLNALDAVSAHYAVQRPHFKWHRPANEMEAGVAGEAPMRGDDGRWGIEEALVLA